MTRPPARTNSRMTALSGSRAGFVEPTSKVCHVPSPMTGKSSPVLGIALRIRVSPIANSPVSATTPALSAARSSARRDRVPAVREFGRSMAHA